MEYDNELMAHIYMLRLQRIIRKHSHSSLGTMVWSYIKYKVQFLYISVPICELTGMIINSPCMLYSYFVNNKIDIGTKVQL